MFATMTMPDDAWSALVTAVRWGRGGRVRDGGARRQPARALELYEFEACPFCRKVREVMCELDLEYVCHPCARGSAHRERTPSWERGRKSYPHLIDPNTGASMRESEDIADYLYSTYGPGRPALDRALAWANTLSSAVASTLRPRGRAVRAPLARRTQPPRRLVLYQFEACPYCRKVRETLAALNLEHVSKSAARGSLRRDEVRAHGRMQVPLLIDPNTDRALYESDAICRYLETTYG